MNLVKQALGKRVITVCCRHQRKGSGVRGSKDCQSMISLKQKSDMKPPATEDGKLTQLETAQTGRVKMNVFLAYMRSVGVFTSCIILLLYTLNNIATVYSNFWLSYWSNDAAEANGTIDTGRRDMRLGVYGALGLVQGIFVFGGSLAMKVAGVLASNRLHHSILLGIIHVPLMFFDRTPVGRVINRFSSDVYTLDTTLPQTINMAVNLVIQVVATVAVISLSTPMFLIAFVVLTIPFVFVQVSEVRVFSSNPPLLWLLIVPSAWFTQVTGLLEFGAAYSVALGGLFASRSLHQSLVTSVLRAPMRFFDLTPAGRTVNRVSSDLSMLDLVIPFTLRSMINTVESTAITFGVIAYNMPVFLTVMPVFVVLYCFIQVGSPLSSLAAGMPN
ncbi:Canalicular multispecific organic anion transporter 1 [Lamellibrachia satsuma]|nr:Canalicular multispecific organic anion transporter 1 [Lamellibrachia satsuma]